MSSTAKSSLLSIFRRTTIISPLHQKKAATRARIDPGHGIILHSYHTITSITTHPFRTCIGSPTSVSAFSRHCTFPKTTPGRALMITEFHTSTSTERENDNLKNESIKRPETRPCWKCSTPVPYMTVVCMNPNCKVVQALTPGANYFEILGLSSEPKFDLEAKDLRNKFLRIQQQVHPDSYSQNINGDQLYAQQQSSLVNKAYATLKEPLSRANYILELLGVPIHETESLNEPELLMEVMEARELLEDAQTEEEVEGLKEINNGRIQQAVDGLSKAFREQNLEAAKALAIELQYWIRIQNVIRDWAAGKPIVADHV